MAIEIIVATRYTDPYAGAKFERKAHGMIIRDGKEIASTLQCPHCNAHFVSMAGSGIKRSWCPNCNAVTCGKKECVERCEPWERRMEAIERKATQALRGL